MNIVPICVIGIFAAITSAALKKYNGEISVMMIIAAITAICLISFPLMLDTVESVQSFTEKANISSEYISVLLKSLGICYITQISSDICKENGGGAVASQIEIAGKLIILSLAIPLYGNLINMICEFL